MSKTGISPAFDELERRAIVLSGDDPLDRISLRDHLVDVEIGAFQSERGKTQRLAFNVVVEVLPSDGAETDDVDKILSYDTITHAISTELAAERLNLLETLAERIAMRILAEPQAERVFVRIEKLDRGPGALGVEIVRSHADSPETALSPEDVLQPIVVNMDAAAVASPHLTGWLDQLAETGRAVFFFVDSLPPAAQVSSEFVQKRIDLLAMEQAAWTLADRDPRCVVVESRTELAHARDENLFAVWAPSKIILDAVEKPAFDIHDTSAMARWFSDEFDAVGLVTIAQNGGQSPENPTIDLGFLDA